MIKLTRCLILVFILFINLNPATANQDNLDLFVPLEKSSESPEAYKPNLLAKIKAPDSEEKINAEKQPSNNDRETIFYEPPDFLGDLEGDTVPAYSNSMPQFHKPELHKKD